MNDNPKKRFADYGLKMDKYNHDANEAFDAEFQNFQEQLDKPSPENLPKQVGQEMQGGEGARTLPSTLPSAAKNPNRNHSPLNHKQQAEIARGKKRIEARLDLHQLNRQQAFGSVMNFIDFCYLKQKRLLLIITGKGNGILKDELPLWLTNPRIADKILHHDLAVPQHGGAGARYVYLTKNRAHHDGEKDS